MATWRDRVDGAATGVANALSSVARWTRREGRELKPRLEHERKKARLRRERHALVRQRNRLFLQMGAKVFSLHQRGKVKNADLLGWCQEVEGIVEGIDGKSVEIKAADEQFERLRGVVLEEEVDEAAGEDDEEGIEADDEEETAAEDAKPPGDEGEKKSDE